MSSMMTPVISSQVCWKMWGQEKRDTEISYVVTEIVPLIIMILALTQHHQLHIPHNQAVVNNQQN